MRFFTDGLAPHSFMKGKQGKISFFHPLQSILILDLGLYGNSLYSRLKNPEAKETYIEGRQERLESFLKDSYFQKIAQFFSAQKISLKQLFYSHNEKIFTLTFYLPANAIVTTNLDIKHKALYKEFKDEKTVKTKPVIEKFLQDIGADPEIFKTLEKFEAENSDLKNAIVFQDDTLRFYTKKYTTNNKTLVFEKDKVSAGIKIDQKFYEDELKYEENAKKYQEKLICACGLGPTKDFLTKVNNYKEELDKAARQEKTKPNKGKQHDFALRSNPILSPNFDDRGRSQDSSPDASQSSSSNAFFNLQNSNNSSGIVQHQQAQPQTGMKFFKQQSDPSPGESKEDKKANPKKRKHDESQSSSSTTPSNTVLNKGLEAVRKQEAELQANMKLLNKKQKIQDKEPNKDSSNKLAP